MSGIAQLVGGLNPAGGEVPTINNPFDLNALLGMGLSPPQQALVNFLGGEQDERTRDIYARLGLGGSTMLAQDLGSNELQRLAQSAELIRGNQDIALRSEQGSLAAQSAQAQAQNQAFNQGQTNLKNITGGLGSLASAAGSLFG